MCSPPSPDCGQLACSARGFSQREGYEGRGVGLHDLFHGVGYPPDSQEKCTAENIIGKQRNGPIGTVRLTFLGEHKRFENFATPGSY